ncbi:hypothetical protein A4G20_00800 [Pasteurellaceae bacterium RH1A]|nr:hypothetical protein A4G20_00800 [Pasteurellaceae bacterium RH1A]
MAFSRGDHLYTIRTGYTHHGIYIGNGQVIHYSGFADGFNRGPVEVTTLEKFANGQEFGVINHPVRVYNAEESVVRAESRLGEDLYDLVLNNCDAFVLWCIQGINVSYQVVSTATTAAATYQAYKTYATYATGGAVITGGLSSSGIIVSTVPLASNPVTAPLLIGLGLAVMATNSDKLVDTAGDVISGTLDTVVNAANVTANVASDIVDITTCIASGVVSGAVSVASDAISSTVEVVGDVASGAVDVVSDVASSTVDAVSSGVRKIFSIFD